MLKGVNDLLADAKALVKLLAPGEDQSHSVQSVAGSQYECSDWDQIEKFSEIVFNAGYAFPPVRTPRGRDILAACGQLKSETRKSSPRASGWRCGRWR